ncbi:homeobox-leucine zipper protein HAT22 [Ricinus communis]|uniref:homeobox-leucine zipper protein HAT22 n=1 Tax=Ricinus communis TaxID=3988 RepID=UPI00201AAA6E|nr:homeobox-leucine zipper protein HAT22 [Ricinus communis]
MGCLDDGCNTGLVLGLGFTTATISNPDSTINNQNNQKPKTKPCLKFDQMVGTASFEPSLSLGLSAHHIGSSNNKMKIDVIKKATCHEDSVDLFRQASPHSCSAVSSFSSGRVKRERDFSSEEIDVERVSSRISDEDEDGTNTRKKLRLTKEQSALLEESFKQHSTLNPKQKQALARQLNLRPRQVEVWFQNRRARTKLKQTEVDCEFLKKCCETLTDENRRLQKELQELKALKLAQPFYMHMPAATLTMCPSCERIGGVGDAASKNNPFSMAPKPHHFYNPFTNPSAAC